MYAFSIAGIGRCCCRICTICDFPDYIDLTISNTTNPGSCADHANAEQTYRLPRAEASYPYDGTVSNSDGYTDSAECRTFVANNLSSNCASKANIVAALGSLDEYHMVAYGDIFGTDVFCGTANELEIMLHVGVLYSPGLNRRAIGLSFLECQGCSASFWNTFIGQNFVLAPPDTWSGGEFTCAGFTHSWTATSPGSIFDGADIDGEFIFT